MGVFFNPGVLGVLGPENGFIGAAVAVVHDNNLVNIVELDRDIEMFPESFVPSRVFIRNGTQQSAR